MTAFMYVRYIYVCAFNKGALFGFINCRHFFAFVYFEYCLTVETKYAYWAFSGYIYTAQSSMDMDIDGYPRKICMDMDMDIYRKFHIRRNPVNIVDKHNSLSVATLKQHTITQVKKCTIQLHMNLFSIQIKSYI